MFTFNHNPKPSRDAVLTKQMGLGQGFSSLVTGDGGAERTLACFLPYGFSKQNVSTFWFSHNGQSRVRKSSDRRVVGQLLVTLFQSFQGEVF